AVDRDDLHGVPRMAGARVDIPPWGVLLQLVAWYGRLQEVTAEPLAFRRRICHCLCHVGDLAPGFHYVSRRHRRRGALAAATRRCCSRWRRCAAAARAPLRRESRPAARRSLSRRHASRAAAHGEPRSRPPVAHVPRHGGAAVERGAAGRLGSAGQRTARPLYRSLPLGVRAHGASQDNATLRTRGLRMVDALAQCQRTNGTGYLSAFPEELFDRLREGRRVWAPFYTVHKIMAGLLDTYTLSGYAPALEVLRGMVRWTGGWTQPLGDEAMARVLEREYGGMNEVLYNLSAVTNSRADAELAHRFDHERIFTPLAQGRDELKGLHVNTTIPKIIGAARRYELTGDARYHDVASYFWHEVTGRRAYCTGGTRNGESWQSDPGVLSTELSGYTQECCTTYNMLKLTRHLFTWTADPRLADFYERALFNGILGTQHPADGMTLYYVPLASGYWKLFGQPLHSFWCCNGTGLESHSKLGDSIYFQDERGLYVNLFIPSELDWRERDIRVVQDTRFPEEERTRFTLHCARPVRMVLRLRVPFWTAPGGSVAVNGRTDDVFAAPGSYVVLDRTWRDGDRVELTLPMQLHVQPMP